MCVRALKLHCVYVCVYGGGASAGRAAILHNEVGSRSGQTARIEGGKRFQVHTVRALELRPDDAALHHMMARFYYELAGIGWLVRAAAKQLFGEIPAAGYEDALRHLLKAQELNSAWVLNSLWVAKTQNKLGMADEARQTVRKALQLPQKREEDRVAHTALLKLQAQLG